MLFRSHAKRRGKNRHRFYSAKLHARARERLRLEGELRRAVERDELSVRYQPQVSARALELVGVEALVRWRHPERGLLGPDEFVPLAEETGQIGTIGAWVLRRACAEARAFAEARGAPLAVRVNIAAPQLRQRDLAQTVGAILKETGLEPGRLALEITESAVMDDLDAAARHLDRLAAMGVGVYLDDFGTGYSSFAHLKRFALTGLKLPGAFVGHLDDRPDDRAIVEAIVALARALDLSVIAEGVETPSQLAALRELGCEEIQGFLLSRPVPPAAVPRLPRRFPAR